MPVLRTLAPPGGSLSYTLTRKRVKNLNLRIRRDGSVAVSAPSRVPLARIDAFVLSRAETILASQERLRQAAAQAPGPLAYQSGDRIPFLGGFLTLEVSSGPTDAISRRGNRLLLTLKAPDTEARRKKLTEAFLDTLCREVLEGALADVYPFFEKRGIPIPELKIRRMKSRWGSCFYTQGRITLNRALLAAPLPCIRYVAAHELCHFLVPNHSRDFYDLLSSAFPDWAACRAELNRRAAAYL